MTSNIDVGIVSRQILTRYIGMKFRQLRQVSLFSRRPENQIVIIEKLPGSGIILQLVEIVGKQTAVGIVVFTVLPAESITSPGRRLIIAIRLFPVLLDGKKAELILL